MYIIFGAGITGISVAKYLQKNNQDFMIYDQNPDIKLKLQNRFGKNTLISENDIIYWQKVKAIILSPGINIKHQKNNFPIKQAINNNINIINDIELFWGFNKNSKFIAITGTNGKSTTTSLTNYILKENKIKISCGGNIGTGCFDLPKDAKYLLELSSYQLENIKNTRINIATIINISPDHLDRHGSMKNYIEAKKKIFLNQKKGDFALINIDQKETLEIYKELKENKDFQANIIPISNKQKIIDGFCLFDNKILYQNQQILLPNLKLKGEHNKQNIIFAFTIAKLLGINDKEIIKSISKFSGLRYRMDFCGKINNINFINDSKSTNVKSSEGALKTYDNIYWILGGKEKGDDIMGLQKLFPKIKHVFLIGQSSNNFAIKLKNKIQFSLCKTLEKAFFTAYNKACLEKSEINILFSPACSSFDQWQNFEQRGDAFYKLASKIIKNEK